MRESVATSHSPVLSVPHTPVLQKERAFVLQDQAEESPIPDARVPEMVPEMVPQTPLKMTTPGNTYFLLLVI